jgi:CRISPR-associated protein Csx17
MPDSRGGRTGQQQPTRRFERLACQGGETMTEPIVLYGCAPDPLIHYLKALGVLRLVAEQLDSQTRGAWLGDAFMLETSKTKDEIIAFFLNDYCPTPIIAPWNGSSGFYPSDKKQSMMIETLCDVKSPRFNSYRQTVQAAQSVVGEREQQPKDEEKSEMLRASRRVFPEAALDWLDAAYVLGQDKPDYPPLLGSGGNDGRLDFTVNFIARLLSALPEFLIDEKRPQERIKQSTAQLRAALFTDGATQLEKAAVGQFHPAGAGGANAEQGVRGDSFVNPWDFILAIEGSLLLASATVRQLAAGARTKSSFPFTVRNSSVGYSTATIGEKIRAELWLPLWSRLSSYAEIAHIFREGRVQFSHRRKVVRTGFDFARAVAELGVDRGIESFQRYAFIERNGQANIATPLGRFEVRERPRARLIHDIDQWLESFSRAASGDRVQPRFVRAQQRIEDTIFRLCESGSADHLRGVLISLGRAEAELAGGEKFRHEMNLRPIAGLRLSWASECNDYSDEFNLASALASICSPDSSSSIRENIDPVNITEMGVEWAAKSVRAVWGTGSLEDNLASVLHRRSIEARANSLTHPILTSRRFAPLKTVNAFLNGETDDAKVEELLGGLILLDWHRAEQDFKQQTQTREVAPSLPRAYALLKLLFLPDGKFQRDEESETITIKHEPAIVPLLKAGRVQDALQIAYQRLQASGLTPATREFHYDNAEGTRLAAALLIPIDEPSIYALAELVLRDKPEER